MTAHRMIGDIEHKRCPRCRRWLPLICYSINYVTGDELAYHCRECYNAEQHRMRVEQRFQRRYGKTCPLIKIRRWAASTSPFTFEKG